MKPNEYIFIFKLRLNQGRQHQVLVHRMGSALFPHCLCQCLCFFLIRGKSEPCGHLEEKQQVSKCYWQGEICDSPMALSLFVNFVSVTFSCQCLLFCEVVWAGNKFFHGFYRIVEQPFPGGTPIKKSFILIHRPKSNI